MLIANFFGYFQTNGWTVDKIAATANIYNYSFQCHRDDLQLNLLFVYFGNKLCSYTITDYSGDVILRSDHRLFKDLEIAFKNLNIPNPNPIAQNELVEGQLTGTSSVNNDIFNYGQPWKGMN